MAKKKSSRCTGKSQTALSVLKCIIKIIIRWTIENAILLFYRESSIKQSTLMDKKNIRGPRRKVGNPSHEQRLVRLAFQTVQKNWYHSDLTEGEKNQWLQWALNNPQISSKGEAIYLTANLAYGMFNIIRVRNGLPLLRTPPE